MEVEDAVDLECGLLEVDNVVEDEILEVDDELLKFEDVVD